MIKNSLAILTLVSFLVTGIVGPMPAYAQDYHLPAPGVMVHLSPEFNPPILKGIKVHPDNPFRFDFILDKGDSQLSNNAIKDESSKLIKYFLASLTIPEKDLWVNLSPYEKDRIIPQSFGLTEMGRDLLAEDYMLKQITASLIYPEDEIGKKFWKRIYEEAQKRYGTTNIPVNTFNKVWIVPEKAVVYENAKAGTAYVVESKLKVMLEQDYLSLAKHEGIQSEQAQTKDTNQLGSQIVREIVIPELTTEVNENKNFAHLRQVYNSLILATWYKKKIKDSILEQVYTNRNKVAGVNIDDPQEKEKIYQRYLKAFKKGVYNYIKEEQDPLTQQVIPKKYFSGGETFLGLGNMAQIVNEQTMDFAMRSSFIRNIQNLSLILVATSLTIFSSANTMSAQSLPTPSAVAQAVGNTSVVSNEGLESVPALEGNVALNEVGNKKSFPRTGIYRIGPEYPGKPSVLFIHGAWGSPNDFIQLLTKFNGESNIFVFKYDFKKALDNANDLRAWLDIWAAYLKQNGGIFVVHSFGNNVFVKAVEGLPQDDPLRKFFTHSEVIQLAPTLNGSLEVGRYMKKPGGGVVGGLLGIEKLGKAQDPNGDAIGIMRKEYGSKFLGNFDQVFTIFADGNDKHNGSGKSAEENYRKIAGLSANVTRVVTEGRDPHTDVLLTSYVEGLLRQSLDRMAKVDRAMTSNMEKVSKRSNSATELLNRAVTKDGNWWDLDKRFQNLEIYHVTKLSDVDMPKFPVFMLQTNHGDFLTILDSLESGIIQTVAIGGSVGIGSNNSIIYLDFSDRDYFGKIRGALQEQFNNYNKIYVNNREGKLYAPFIKNIQDTQILEKQVHGSIFLRHLIESSGISERGLSLAGVYHFAYGANSQGAMNLDPLPQVFVALIRTEKESYLSRPGGVIALAHEIVHVAFNFLLNNRYDEIRNWLRQSHADFLDQVVANYYRKRITILTPDEAERLKINEGLAMLYDSFIGPRFDAQGGATIRLNQYRLISEDVDFLINLRLIPERFRPSLYGYRAGRQIDINYYSKVLSAMANDGLIAEAEQIIQSINTSHGGPEQIRARLLASITQVEGHSLSKKREGTNVSSNPITGGLAFDSAQNASVMPSVDRKGGIDLTPANMHLQTQNAGESIKFHLNPAQLAQLQNALGFVPVIINIRPMTDIRAFLGLNDSPTVKSG